MGDPTKVRVGPGTLYFAPIGTPEPVDLVAAWNVAWVQVGYTEEGHEATVSPNFEAIEVAEELTPIRYDETGREISVAFSMAEVTASNVQKALNGGTITSGTGIVTFEPPALGSVTRIMIGWQSNDGLERWVFRQCVQTGDVALGRRKAPTKALISTEFKVEKPAGAQPFKAIFSTV